MRRAAIALSLLAACASEGGPDPEDMDPDPVFTDEERAALAELDYAGAVAPVADPSNAYAGDAAAQALGRVLFFSTELSGPLLDRDNDGTSGTLGQAGEAGRIACASCHVAEDGFVDTRSPHRQISLAAKWTPRRSPTLLDVAAAPLFNWDGRRDSLWSQALGVMEATGEFNASRLYVAEQMFRLHRAEYEAIFGPMPALDGAGFPQLTPAQAGCEDERADTVCHGRPGSADYDAMDSGDRDAVTRVAVNTSKAIAAYLGQLRCGPGRFDAWLAGDATAMSRAEQRGAALFAGRAGCVTCHSGPHFTDGEFHNVGLRPATVATAFTDVDDRGAAVGLADLAGDPLATTGAYSDGPRGAIPAVTAAHEGAFRTPTLRCISTQPSFMHTGQLRTLAEVVGFFARGGDGAGYPGTNELTAVELSPRERADLVAFMAALQGDAIVP